MEYLGSARSGVRVVALGRQVVGGLNERGRNMRRSVLLLAVVLVLIGATAALATPPAESGDRRAVVETLYADGSINCPDHWADDLSTPVGRVVFRPTTDGIHFHVVFTDAAPNWEYEVVVNLESGDFIEYNALQAFESLTTNKNGTGVFSGTFLADPGTYSIEVNVVSAQGDPLDPKYGEIGPSGFAQVTVR